MKQITEEQKVHEQWYADASKQTLETLPDFLKSLLEDYGHDYGTICHALAAGAVATAWAMNKHDNAGITGFQAGAVMWEFIRHWNRTGNKTGLRLVDYDNFLYPQYADEYQRVISKDTWDAIQREAEKNIDEANKEYAVYLEKKKDYEVKIKAFVEKYPDYYEKKEFYDPLGCGTGDQWEAERKKKESGFEFAPQEPYEPVYKHHPVYKHWESICAGIVPFGYRVGKTI
jgi:hypothetical protein